MPNNFLTASWNAPKNIKTIITTNLIPAEALMHNHTLDFNLATHVGNDINVVLRNRKILNQFLPSRPHWLRQTHSNNVLEIDKITIQRPEYQDYDAAITFSPNQVCVILTADCIPILLTDISGGFVAAIHAGRVGIAKNIIKNTIGKISTASHKIFAYIAPAICQKHYEVDKDILREFNQLNSKYAKFFQKKITPDKFSLDLNGIAVLQLLDAGLLVQNIYQSNICTYCHHDKFYSYRENKNTGRFASCIWKI